MADGRPSSPAASHPAGRSPLRGETRLNFHDRFRSDEWLLLANESIWAGRGRTHGRCTVWTEDGRLVATYTQDNLVRTFGDQRDHSSEFRRVM